MYSTQLQFTNNNVQLIVNFQNNEFRHTNKKAQGIKLKLYNVALCFALGIRLGFSNDNIYNSACINCLAPVR